MEALELKQFERVERVEFLAHKMKGNYWTNYDNIHRVYLERATENDVWPDKIFVSVKPDGSPFVSCYSKSDHDGSKNLAAQIQEEAEKFLKEFK